MESFTLVERTASSEPHHLFDDVVHLGSGKIADHDFSYIASLRENNPGMIVTAIPTNNLSLRTFAAAGHATCELDTKTDSYASFKGYAPPARRSEGGGGLGEAINFAKYRTQTDGQQGNSAHVAATWSFKWIELTYYRWSNEDFSLYTVGPWMQYVLKECQEGEHVLGASKITDKLITTAGGWLMSRSLRTVWVFDWYWRQDKALYDQVMKSSWDDVILDESMKKDLTNVTNKFFSSKDIYENLGVPWKRGLLFHGPPGNGKTVSIRALMHSLYDRDDPIPTLYVKDAPYTFHIREVFSQARALAPCMLILEDIETIVTPETRSYYFNEMDGLENNDGLFVVASTNFLDKLDPGLSKRPSRFDRKYNFPLPDESERILYCEYWRRKLKSNKDIEFPKKLCPAMAAITDGFSFAFLQECFVATLLTLARGEDEDAYSTRRNDRKPKPFDGDNDDLNDYKLWVAFKKQAEILRKEVESQKPKSSQLSQWLKMDEKPVEAAMSYPASGRAEPGCHSRCRCQGEHRAQKGKGVVGSEMRARDEILSELPWYCQKQRFINSAAFEWKVYPYEI